MNKRYEAGLQSLAAENGLRLDKETSSLFGEKSGYTILMQPVNFNSYQFTVSVAVSNHGQLPDAATFKTMCKESKALAACKVHGYKAVFTLRASAWSNKKTFALVGEALGAIVDGLRRNGYENCCQSCGQIIETDAYSVSGNGMILCEPCFTKASNTADQNQQERSRKKENVIGGVVGAFLGSVLGALVIVGIGRLGYVSFLSGVIMGVCTLKGYELLGGQLTKKGIVISSILILGMVYVGNNADWAITVAQYFDTDFISAFRAVPALVQEDYIDRSVYIYNLILVYIFALLGAAPSIVGVLRNRQVANITRKMGTTGTSYTPSAPEY